jgi:hypothetical protein
LPPVDVTVVGLLVALLRHADGHLKCPLLRVLKRM